LAVFERIRYRRADESVFSYAFDLLELDGQDLRREPIETRKGSWRACCAAVGSGCGWSSTSSTAATVVYRHACKFGCEGIVSKRLGSPYVSGRTRHWLKFKNPAAPAVKREAEEEWGWAICLQQRQLPWHLILRQFWPPCPKLEWWTRPDPENQLLRHMKRMDP
jgi:ATP dependent DNA ligase domain